MARASVAAVEGELRINPVQGINLKTETISLLMVRSWFGCEMESITDGD